MIKYRPHRVTIQKCWTVEPNDFENNFLITSQESRFNDSAIIKLFQLVCFRFQSSSFASIWGSSLEKKSNTVKAQTSTLGSAETFGTRKTDLSQSASNNGKPLARMSEIRWRNFEGTETIGKRTRETLRQRYFYFFNLKKICYLLKESYF